MQETVVHNQFMSVKEQIMIPKAIHIFDRSMCLKIVVKILRIVLHSLQHA